MAMNVGHRAGAIADINVTPMADVMIVLLIIFMVFTSAVAREDALELPQAEHARAEPHASGPLEVTLGEDRGVRVAGRRLADGAALAAELRTLLDERPERARDVYVRAGRGASYDDVDSLARALRAAGAEQIELVVTPK